MAAHARGGASSARAINLGVWPWVVALRYTSVVVQIARSMSPVRRITASRAAFSESDTVSRSSSNWSALTSDDQEPLGTPSLDGRDTTSESRASECLIFSSVPCATAALGTSNEHCQLVLLGVSYATRPLHAVRYRMVSLYRLLLLTSPGRRASNATSKPWRSHTVEAWIRPLFQRVRSTNASRGSRGSSRHRPRCRRRSR